MIEATKAYKTSDGATHATLEDAQKHEILALLPGEMPKAEIGTTTAEHIVKNRDKVLAILKLKPRRAAKKASSPKKPPTKPKAVAADAA